MLVHLLLAYGSITPNPTLVDVPTPGFPRWKRQWTEEVVTHVTVDASAVIPLVGALACIKSKELSTGRQLLFSLDGAYYHRYINGTTKWSKHAHGLAVDINARKKQPMEVVKCFREAGWKWGGDWKGATHDPMHFQLPGP